MDGECREREADNDQSKGQSYLLAMEHWVKLGSGQRNDRTMIVVFICESWREQDEIPMRGLLLLVLVDISV